MIALLALATATVVDPAVTDFERFCLSGRPAHAILAAAERAGWKSGGADAPKQFDPATQRYLPTSGGALVLRAEDTTSAGETRQGCGIIPPQPDIGMAAALEQDLGVAPAFHAGTAATFNVIKTDNGWRAGTDRSEWKKAHDEGRLYSIMTSGGSPSFIATLHVLANGSH
ncbi:MAG: hypothetical protein ABGW87_12625 [Sphingomonadaceae bacterium]